MEAAIDKTWKDFFARDLPSKKKGKERYFGIYTDYDGPNFSFFCGVEVDSFVGMSSDLQSMMIPAQNYAKFTVGPEKSSENLGKLYGQRYLQN